MNLPWTFYHRHFNWIKIYFRYLVNITRCKQRDSFYLLFLETVELKSFWNTLYKRVIITKITYAAIAWRVQRATYIMITRAMRTTPTKVLEMFLDLPTLRTAKESVALMAAYSLRRPNSKNLGIGHYRIWTRADNTD